MTTMCKQGRGLRAMRSAVWSSTSVVSCRRIPPPPLKLHTHTPQAPARSCFLACLRCQVLGQGTPVALCLVRIGSDDAKCQAVSMQSLVCLQSPPPLPPPTGGQAPAGPQELGFMASLSCKRHHARHHGCQSALWLLNRGQPKLT